MRTLLRLLAALTLACGAMASQTFDPGSDAPQFLPARTVGVVLPATYAQALSTWRDPSDVNAWIGARFDYDFDRSARLSENQRALGPAVRIYEPEVFFDRPSGVCVDLARFAVQTLRAVSPSAKAAYLMVEFDPAVIAGNTLRRHWLVQFERDGKLYFFADSKRPGHVAGPYSSTQEFIAEYSQYRQRRVVSHKALESHERKLRQQAPRAGREGRANDLFLRVGAGVPLGPAPPEHPLPRSPAPGSGCDVKPSPPCHP